MAELKDYSSNRLMSLLTWQLGDDLLQPQHQLPGQTAQSLSSITNNTINTNNNSSNSNSNSNINNGGNNNGNNISSNSQNRTNNIGAASSLAASLASSSSSSLAAAGQNNNINVMGRMADDDGCGNGAGAGPAGAAGATNNSGRRRGSISGHIGEASNSMLQPPSANIFSSAPAKYRTLARQSQQPSDLHDGLSHDNLNDKHHHHQQQALAGADSSKQLNSSLLNINRAMPSASAGRPHKRRRGHDSNGRLSASPDEMSSALCSPATSKSPSCSPKLPRKLTPTLSEDGSNSSNNGSDIWDRENDSQRGAKQHNSGLKSESSSNQNQVPAASQAKRHVEKERERRSRLRALFRSLRDAAKSVTHDRASIIHTAITKLKLFETQVDQLQLEKKYLINQLALMMNMVSVPNNNTSNGNNLSVANQGLQLLQSHDMSHTNSPNLNELSVSHALLAAAAAAAVARQPNNNNNGTNNNNNNKTLHQNFNCNPHNQAQLQAQSQQQQHFDPANFPFAPLPIPPPSPTSQSSLSSSASATSSLSAPIVAAGNACISDHDREISSMDDDPTSMAAAENLNGLNNLNNLNLNLGSLTANLANVGNQSAFAVNEWTLQQLQQLQQLQYLQGMPTQFTHNQSIPNNNSNMRQANRQVAMHMPHNHQTANPNDSIPLDIILEDNMNSRMALSGPWTTGGNFISSNTNAGTQNLPFVYPGIGRNVQIPNNNSKTQVKSKLDALLQDANDLNSMASIHDSFHTHHIS